MNPKYYNFSILLILLSFFDIVTTQYALNTNPSLREGNFIMALVTGSLWLFLIVKAIGVLFIIRIYDRIKKQSKVGAKVGQTVIIALMLLIVGNNIYIISANALPFNSFTATTGTIGNGNGFIANEMTIFNLTSERNIYVMAEGGKQTGIFIVEPIGFALGTSGSQQIVVGDPADEIKYALVGSDGSLYYSTATKILKRKNNIGLVYSNNSNENIVIYTHSNEIMYMVEYNSKVYFLDGTTLKSFSLDGLYTVVVERTGFYSPFDVFTIDSVGSIYIYSPYPNDNNNIYKYNSTCNPCTTSFNNSASLGSIISTSNYIFAFAYAGTPYDLIFKKGNTTLYKVNYISSTITKAGGAHLGGFTNIGLKTISSSQYDTFSFLESGTVTPAGVVIILEPAEIIYNSKTISPSYSNYYNTSNILLNIKIDADSGYNLLGSNYLINLALYRWRVDIVDPNGVMVNQVSTSTCVDSWAPLNPTGRCLMTQAYRYSSPSAGWLPGTWTANLYETAAGGHVAYLASTTWNVYNGSTNGTGTISNPIEPITSDSNQATITLFDNYVGLLGFGINSVSKFLFSLLIIIILFVVGMWKGSGNIGLALATIPYTFFTFIGYVPKWVFVVYIIMLVMIAKVFK